MIVQEEEEKKEGHQDQEQSSVEETVEDEEAGWESTTPVPVVTKRTPPKRLAIVPDTPTTANTTMMSIDSQVYDDDTTAVADNRGGTVQSVGASSMDLVSANSWLSHNHYIEDDPFLEESDESSAGNWEPILDPDLEEEEEQENQTITLFPTAPQSQEIQDYDVEVEIDLESAILPLLQEKSTMPYQNRQARSAAAAVTATSSSTDKSKQDTGKNRFTKILVINVIVTILMATGILDVDDLLSRPIFSFTHYQNNYNPDQPHLASFLFLQRDRGNSSTIPTRQQRTLRRNTRRTVKSHETTVTTQKREYQNSTFARHTPWLEDLHNDEEPQFQGLLRTDSIFFKISTNTHNTRRRHPRHSWRMTRIGPNGYRRCEDMPLSNKNNGRRLSCCYGEFYRNSTRSSILRCEDTRNWHNSSNSSVSCKWQEPCWCRKRKRRSIPRAIRDD
ncbi:expressed unknown protein [Seminavis robusta]|uniref:Uncharacterized protein n=1 Tax=Seminavis robusta TaxID=568900 RepID=A0A9N8HXD7_9STRA|nr:expressed unknown protein [Seminavis robusta]|eukprot:Sro3047_g342790.1 n/a (446) ;mRNA; r:1935-3272